MPTIEIDAEVVAELRALAEEARAYCMRNNHGGATWSLSSAVLEHFPAPTPKLAPCRLCGCLPVEGTSTGYVRCDGDDCPLVNYPIFMSPDQWQSLMAPTQAERKLERVRVWCREASTRSGFRKASLEIFDILNDDESEGGQ